MYYTDYGSFAEIAVKAVGNSASMSAPGVLGQFVSKSGGNAYHGNLYFDYQSEAIEATNISEEQVAMGLAGCARFDQDLNRMECSATSTSTWAAISRRTSCGGTAHPLHEDGPALPDPDRRSAGTWNPVYTTKWTYNVGARHKLIGFFQFHNKGQPDYLGSIRMPSRASADARTRSGTRFPVKVWKASTTRAVAARSSRRESARTTRSGHHGKSTAPRIEDSGAQLSPAACGTDCGVTSADQRIAELLQGRVGREHTFKVGGEVMKDILADPFPGFRAPTQTVSMLNNSAPTQVELYPARTCRKAASGPMPPTRMTASGSTSG